MTRRSPTLQDVARRAGVHPATVSRALSRPDMVAPATRSVVLEAVEQIGFVPNRSARQLVRGRFDAVGVIVPDITNPYFGAILQAIQGDARGVDLAVLIADTAADPDEEARALEALGRQVDGLVAITPITDLAAAPVPVLQVNRRSRSAPSVAVDQQAIVEAAVQHLAALGHSHLALVRGPAPYWAADRRMAAAQRVVERFDVRVDVVGPVPPTFEGGRQALPIVGGTGATGVLAFNDLQAAGLLVAADAAGCEVPSDLSVVGSDGLDLAQMTSPPLTTVTAPLEDLGRVALGRLTALLRGDDLEQHTTLDPRLVVRGTTAPPAGAHGASRRHREDNR